MSTKLKSITKGSQIMDQIFWELLKLLNSGQPATELSLAQFIKKRAKQLGASGLAFPPIVSFGPNSAEIHHKPNKTRIGKNNFLMLDYGVKVNGYCSDFTRTLFLGRPQKIHEKIYNTVLRAQLAGLKLIKPEAECFRIDLAAREVIIEAGFGRHYNHHTGHAVGKKIHEPPSFSATSPSTLSASRSPLIMTVEPGIYLPGRFGVRIEDMVLVSNKPKIFSKVPKDFKSMIVA